MKQLKAYVLPILWGLSLTTMLPAPAVMAQSPKTMYLNLQDAENQALDQSLETKRLDAMTSSAQEMLEAQRAAAYMPKLSLDGTYRYLSDVPTLNIGPTEIPFGQHNNYSIGPQITYNVYHGGSDALVIASSNHLVQSQLSGKRAVQLQVIRDVRMAYAGVAGAIEELALVRESLQLSQTTLKDVERRLQAGSISRVDLLSAKREQSNLRLQYLKAQSALTDNLERLASLVSYDGLPEPLVPTGAADGEQVAGLPPSNLTVKLEPMDAIISSLIGRVPTALAENHPALQSLDELAAANRAAADSTSRSWLPKVNVFAQSMYVYPNGPIDEKIVQNSIGVNLSMMLFDGQTAARQAASKHAAAQATEMQRSAAQRDLSQSWRLARAQLLSLRSQQTIASDAVKITQQEAKLTRTNYQLGATTILAVQTADHEVLAARTTLLRLKSQEIGLLAGMDYLAADEKPSSTKMPPHKDQSHE